jgi:hypothetical protein
MTVGIEGDPEFSWAGLVHSALEDAARRPKKARLLGTRTAANRRCASLGPAPIFIESDVEESPTFESLAHLAVMDASLRDHRLRYLLPVDLVDHVRDRSPSATPLDVHRAHLRRIIEDLSRNISLVRMGDSVANMTLPKQRIVLETLQGHPFKSSGKPIQPKLAECWERHIATIFHELSGSVR